MRGKGLTAGPIAPSTVERMSAAAVTEPPVQGSFCVRVEVEERSRPRSACSVGVTFG